MSHLQNSCCRCCIAFICIFVLLKTFQIMMFQKPRPDMARPVPIRKLHSCQKNIFKDVLLVLIYNFAFYETVPMVKSNYEGAFTHIVVCGPVENSIYDIMVVKHHNGFFGYECVGKAIRLHPGFRGYLYVNDDMIVNWWNFVGLNKDRVWLGAPVNFDIGFKINSRPIPQSWIGWKWLPIAKNCESFFREITSKTSSVFASAMSMHYKNTKNRMLCLRTGSDMFYVPGKRAETFQQLSAVFFKYQVFLSNAVTTSLSMLDEYESWEKPHGIYIPDKYTRVEQTRDSQIGWREYSDKVFFVHPVKFHMNKENSKRLYERVIALSKNKTKC